MEYVKLFFLTIFKRLGVFGGRKSEGENNGLFLPSLLEKIITLYEVIP